MPKHTTVTRQKRQTCLVTHLPVTDSHCAFDMTSPRATLTTVWAMTTLFRVALIATLSATRCFAQTGTVTFYAPGISAKSVAASLLPKSRQPFSGWLFDGRQRLVHVR